MTQLPYSAQEALEDPITIEEIQGAIAETKPGKAPGSDGLTILYYKTLLPSLGPYMVKLFNTEGPTSPFCSEVISPHYGDSKGR